MLWKVSKILYYLFSFGKYKYVCMYIVNINECFRLSDIFYKVLVYWRMWRGYGSL